jgi:ParB family chromosome partitioning protein
MKSMEPRNLNVKSSGLLSTDQPSERERRLAMAVNRLPSFNQGSAPAEAGAPQSSDPDVQQVQKLETNLIVRSAWANRHELNFDSAEFAALREEIRSAGGNVQPIKVRRLRFIKAPGMHEVPARYEIVFGHRRYEACRLEGLPVLAMISQMNDQELFVEMDRENRARKNLSPWEQGQMYRRALDQGLFASRRALAEALGVDHSALSKAVTLAELPQVVIDAFPSPLDLQFRWGQPLKAALSADEAAVLKLADELKARRGQLSAKDVFDALTAQPAVQTRATAVTPALIKIEAAGRRAEISMSDKGDTLVAIESGAVRPEQLPQLEALIRDFLMSGQA